MTTTAIVVSILLFIVAFIALMFSIATRSKLDIEVRLIGALKTEMEMLNRKMRDLEIENQELKLQLKMLQTENVELLKINAIR